MLTGCNHTSNMGRPKIEIIQWRTGKGIISRCSSMIHTTYAVDGRIIFEPEMLVNIHRHTPSIKACRMVCLRIVLFAYDYNVKMSTSLLSRFV